MKLPWDSKYLKICFHVVFTVIVIYILMRVTDAFAFIIVEIKGVSLQVKDFIKGIMSLFSPLLVAMVIAYLFDPVVDFFQRSYEGFHRRYLVPFFQREGWQRVRRARQTQRDKLRWLHRRQERKRKKKAPSRHKRRTAGASLTYLAIFLVIGLLIAFTASQMGGSGAGSESLVDYLAKSAMSTVNEATRLLDNLQIKLEELGVYEQAAKYIDSALESLEAFVARLGQQIILGVASVGAGVMNFFISLVVAFYIMMDKAYLKHIFTQLINTFLPRRLGTGIINAGGDLHAVFSGYIRGQVTDAIIVGFAVGIGLSLVGSRFALFIGVITGFSALIPYFGGFIAFGMSLGLELLMGTPIQAVKSALMIIFVQWLDSMFVVPRVVGVKVNLSPPVVMLSLSIAGSMFGVAGMVLVVPCCAVVKMFAERFYYRYRAQKDAKAEAAANAGTGET